MGGVKNADVPLLGRSASILLRVEPVVRKLSAWPRPRLTSAFAPLATIVTVGLGVGTPSPARAHDIAIEPAQLQREVLRLADSLRFYQERHARQGLPQTPAEQRRVLGAAEIELGLGNTESALQLLMGRLADPDFQALPEYVDTLLMTSEILENQAEDVGAMHYAEQALRKGGSPEQMAEAGARWFRLARRNQRTDRIIEVLNLWRTKGGAEAAGTEMAAQAMYQAAFAMREEGNRAEARAFLGRVPSSSDFGSRATYLAGVLFVEEGNLEQAERWFSAVMDWAIVAEEGTPQHALEREVRDLAALSTARLRYERGDLDGADAAYRRIVEGSEFQREACWERAYLDLERGKKRGALKRVQCVVDLGARGSRAVDAELFRASLLAHMKQYDASIARYEGLHEDLVEERDLFAKTVTNLGERPAEFLFTSMERTAATDGPSSPGPATLFADTWTPELDKAYRVDRGMDHAAADLSVLMTEIGELSSALRTDTALAGFELRKKSLEVLLKEIRHLEGHGRQVLEQASRPHASAVGAVAVAHDHGEDRRALKGLIEHLQVLGTAVEAEIVKVDRDAIRRRQEALTMLQELSTELQGIGRDLEALRIAGEAPINGVARAALGEVKADLDDAAMRAEFGVLDTFWLKKQHRTRSIENLLQQKAETERQVLEAIRDLKN